MVVVDKRILVVDDEEIVRQSCQRALTDEGYTVRTVGSGRDALQACRAESFDVMLTDLRMPDMDGLDVIRAVASEFPEVRVIIITGYPSRESAEQSAKLGIFDYLEKPLSPGRLSAATAAALACPPSHTATAFPMEVPAGVEPHKLEETVAAFPTAVPPGAEPHKLEEAESQGVTETLETKTTNNTTKQAALIALGFLVGVTAAYAIAPVHALAYLAVGTAIASGTILGLFSNAFFAKSGGSKPPG